MLHLKRWLHHQRRQIAVIGSLAFATAVCVALLAVRAVYARSADHFGLLWNLCLAWLPMLCALAAYNLGRRRQRGLWLLIAPCLAFWLLFFPNAPYILTDILHLQPLAHSRTFVFSALFSLCLAAMYFMLTAIIQLRPEEAPLIGERERTQTDADDRVTG
jgi:uncharacterized membrane protein